MDTPPLKEKSKSQELNQRVKAPINRPQLDVDKTLDPPKKSITKSIVLTLVGAVALAGSLFFSFPEIFTQAMTSDSLSNNEIQTIEQQYHKAIASGETIFLPVNYLDHAEREQAKLASGLPEDEAEHLLLEAEAGYTSLAWVTVWDNYAEDGDIVEISAGGMTHIVPILHAPTTIVVPYSIDSAELQIRGIRDGGGGITVAARTAAGSLPLPPMKVGEIRTLRFK